MIPKRGRGRPPKALAPSLGTVGDSEAEEETGIVMGGVKADQDVTLDPEAIVQDEVGGELERIFGTTAVSATKTEPEPNLSTDLSTPAGRPSRKAKTAADKNRAIILKTLKAFEDDLDADTLLAEDDAEEDEEAMYVTGDAKGEEDDDDIWMDEAGKAEEASFLEAEAKDKAEAAVKTSGGEGEEAPTVQKTKVCHVCGHVAQSYVALRNHMMARHEKKKPYLCEICGYAATLESTVERHKRIRHAEGKGAMKYQCPTCDYKCTSPMHLKSHEIIVHQEGGTPFECGICAYQCRRKPTVLKHMKYVHEGAKPFTCPHCQRKYPKQCVLNKHIENVHEKVRPYACDICGHPFAEKRYLEKHIQVVHERLKPIKCHLCDYRCAVSYNLQDHMFNKHTRERPHACHLCDERFLKYGRLAAHLKEKHGQPFKPYRCTDCDYGTDKKSRLLKHRLSEHATSNKMLRCTDCGARFKGEKRLQEHMLSEHQKEAKAFVVKKPLDDITDATANAAEVIPDIGPDAAAAVATEAGGEKQSSAETELEKHLENLTNAGVVDESMAGGPVAKRPKLEPVITEGEVPGETIEVVGADDDIWANQDMIHHEAMIDIERKKSVHFNKVDPDLLEKARQQEIERGGAPVTTKFVVTTKRGDVEEPVVFEIEIREEIAASVSGQRLEEDTKAVMDILAGAESNGIMDSILTNISVQEKEATEAEQRLAALVSERARREARSGGIKDEVDEVLDEEANEILMDAAASTVFDEVSNSFGGRGGGGRGGGGRGKSETKQKVFLCDECGYSCNAMHTLSLHRTFKHGISKVEEESGVTRQCDQCDYTCVHPQHLDAHKQIVHEDGVTPMQCEQCPFQSRGDREMNQHMRALHPEVKPFACKHCDRLFTKKSNMVKHTKMVHEKIKPFACDECGRAFAESRDLKAHVDAVHRKLKPFACHLCDARCARKTQLKVHIQNVHATEKPIYECGECGHRFINKNLLNIHNKAVHQVALKNFQCQFCDFTSTTRALIEAHQRRKHTKERIHCQTCGQDFLTDRKLAAHIRLEHEGGGSDPNAKNYVCDWCDYAGTTQVHLTNHVKAVHENVRRHKCNQCDFTSFATTALKRHVRSVHERQKPYECNECSFKTAYKDSLEQHLSNVHGYGPTKIKTTPRRSSKKAPLEPAQTFTFEQAGGGTGTAKLTVLQEDGTELAVDTDMSVITVGETVIVGDVIQAGDHVIQAGDHVIQAGDHHVIQAGDHVIQAGDHVIQAGDHVIQAGDHVIQAGDHVIQTGDHVVQVGDHVIQAADSKDVVDPHHAGVTTTEDLMALVGIGATNAVQD